MAPPPVSTGADHVTHSAPPVADDSVGAAGAPGFVTAAAVVTATVSENAPVLWLVRTAWRKW